jgi:hypothetical protein
MYFFFTISHWMRVIGGVVFTQSNFSLMKFNKISELWRSRIGWKWQGGGVKFPSGSCVLKKYQWKKIIYLDRNAFPTNPAWEYPWEESHYKNGHIVSQNHSHPELIIVELIKISDVLNEAIRLDDFSVKRTDICTGTYYITSKLDFTYITIRI